MTNDSIKNEMASTHVKNFISEYTPEDCAKYLEILYNAIGSAFEENEEGVDEKNEILDFLESLEELLPAVLRGNLK